MKEERNKAGFVLNDELTFQQQSILDNTPNLRGFIIDAMIAFASQDKEISVKEEVEIWTQVINDCKWCDGSDSSIKGITNHFLRHYKILPLPKTPLLKCSIEGCNKEIGCGTRCRKHTELKGDKFTWDEVTLPEGAIGSLGDI